MQKRVTCRYCVGGVSVMRGSNMVVQYSVAPFEVDIKGI